QGAPLGVARWQLLVGRDHQFKWRSESKYQADQFPHRMYRLHPAEQTSVRKDQLQQWHLHPLRRELSESHHSLAVLVGRQTAVTLSMALILCQMEDWDAVLKHRLESSPGPDSSANW